jgi:hypothetical protein
MIILGCTRAGRITEQHDIFWNWFFKGMIRKSFGLKPKEEYIDAW